MNKDTHRRSDTSCSRRSARGFVAGLLLLTLMGAVACSSENGSSGTGEGSHVMEGWTDGLEAGKALAAEGDKRMIVMFTADWCGPCQELKKAVLFQPEVKQKLADGFVAVRIDLTDNSPSSPNVAVAQQYRVSGIPRLIAMNAEGGVIGSYPGEKDPAAFTAWLDGLAQ